MKTEKENQQIVYSVNEYEKYIDYLWDFIGDNCDTLPNLMCKYVEELREESDYYQATRLY
jgi:hypothetical protein